uniref:HotDog ACOT-type domain-containing protein n=1 Tax=Tetradesmus obliquus TaxID=3088 RepID=A0A383VYQ5_TETOB|eukprot:jgi/Sobl393_1/949/SZX70598.1
MGKIVIPRPPNAVVAEENGCPAVLPFTYNISAFRGRSFEERGLLLHYTPPQAGPAPKQRPPSDSYLSITYPFTSNELLRDQYQRFSSPFLRVGLLLEDMDSFAADVATRHLGGLPPGYTVVTATVDKVAFATARTAAGAAAAAGADSTTAAAAADEAAGEAAAADVGSPPHKLQRQLPPGWGPAAQQQQQPVSGDSATLQSPLTLHSDLRLAGQVAWAGRTSMEVVVEVSTAAVALPDASAEAAAAEDGELDDAPPAAAAAAGASYSRRWLHRAIAHFIMVLRPTGSSSSSGSSGGVVAVPGVVPGTALEQLHFDAAAERSAANRARRASKRLLTGTEPAGDEVSLLYELAEEQLQRQIQQREEHEALSWAGSASTAGRSPTSMQPPCLGPVPMSRSSQSHLAIMHRQDRNNAGSIFGGHLLRLAAELAYSTAVLHAGRHCEAVAMGDVAFKQPVPIGCVLEMRAKVVYTAGALMRVTVVATKHQQLMEQRSASELQSSVTNDFTFVLAAVGSAPLRPVEPESLREALQYLAAHRQHTSDGYSAPALLLRDGMEHVLLAGEGAAAH